MRSLWLHGLLAAAIGGAVGALSQMMIDPTAVRFDLASLKHYAGALVAGALIGVLGYFKQSPLPQSNK